MKLSTFAKALSLVAVFGLFVQLAPKSAHAQARPSSKQNVISIDLLGLAVRQPLNIQYEFKTSPVNSWALRAHYWPGRVSVDNWSSFGIGAAYRIFIADSRALTGLSVAPAADLYFFSSTANGDAVGGHTSTIAWIGGDIAYKWIFDQFAVEPMLGLRIGYTPSVNAPGYATGFVSILAVNVGYAW